MHFSTPETTTLFDSVQMYIERLSEESDERTFSAPYFQGLRLTLNTILQVDVL